MNPLFHLVFRMAFWSSILDRFLIFKNNVSVRLNNLPKTYTTVSGGAGIWTSFTWAQKRSSKPFLLGLRGVFCFLKILFIYFWLRWVFVAVHGLSLVAASGGYSSLRCAGFSLWWLLLLRSTGSRRAGFSSCGSQALERRLSSCGTWA